MHPSRAERAWVAALPSCPHLVARPRHDATQGRAAGQRAEGGDGLVQELRAARVPQGGRVPGEEWGIARIPGGWTVNEKKSGTPKAKKRMVQNGSTGTALGVLWTWTVNT